LGIEAYPNLDNLSDKEANNLVKKFFKKILVLQAVIENQREHAFKDLHKYTNADDDDVLENIDKQPVQQDGTDDEDEPVTKKSTGTSSKKTKVNESSSDEEVRPEPTKSGKGSHDQPSGKGSHDQPSGKGSHDQPSGKGSHDQPSGKGSHDQPSGKGSHDQSSSKKSKKQTSEDEEEDVPIKKSHQPPCQKYYQKNPPKIRMKILHHLMCRMEKLN